MRKVLLSIMMLACMGVYAQSEQEFDCYCNLNLIDDLSGKKVQIEMPDVKSQIRLMDGNGKVLKFKNKSDAITYMSQRGWRYVDSYVEKTNVWFIMSKKVKSIEQAYDGLKTDKKDKD